MFAETFPPKILREQRIIGQLQQQQQLQEGQDEDKDNLERQFCSY